MKNIVKKITAAAMAFTLLGAGSAAIKSVSPKADNTLVASAACQYHRADNTYVDYSTSYKCNYGCKHYAVRCRCCNAIRWYT